MNSTSLMQHPKQKAAKLLGRSRATRGVKNTGQLENLTKAEKSTIVGD